MTSPFLRKINYIKNGFFFMTFGKKYVPSDGIKLRDEITGFDSRYYIKIFIYNSNTHEPLQHQLNTVEN